MAPIFIVGVGRSGTSLLQTMLASHSLIAFPPETGFVRRYVGTGRLNTQDGWISEGEFGHYVNPANEEVVGPIPYSVDLTNTVSDSTLPSWATVNMTFNYDFSRSSFAPQMFDSLTAFLSIENVGDRVPDFFSGNGAGGVNTSFFSGLGRQFRLGMRMEF